MTVEPSILILLILTILSLLIRTLDSGLVSLVSVSESLVQVRDS